MSDDKSVNCGDAETAKNCEDVVRSLWDFLDGELDENATAQIQAHLDACGHCKSHADFERDVVSKLAGLRREHSDPERLKEQVLQTLREAGMEPTQG